MSAEYRHESACAFRGQTLTQINLNSDLCCCDPHGAKARAQEVLLGRLARRDVLLQAEVWYPKEGDPVQLGQMSLRWKKNLLAFLERRADALQTAACWSLALGPQPSGDAARDDFDSMLAEELEAKPTTWLYRQPLVVRLEQLIREGHDGPVDRFDPTKVVTA